MSSYLTFYLVPKKTRTKYNTTEEIEITKGEQLALLSYSRNSNIYRVIKEELNPVYIGMEEPQYSELTVADMHMVIRHYQADIEKSKRIYNSKLEVISNVKTEDYIQDLIDDRELLKEMEETLVTLKYLRSLVEEIEYSDFEKVLINID